MQTRRRSRRDIEAYLERLTANAHGRCPARSSASSDRDAVLARIPCGSELGSQGGACDEFEAALYTPPLQCTPGDTRSCLGLGSCSGLQTCQSDASSFSTCEC